MWPTFITVILLVLLAARGQENTKTLQKLGQIVASLGDDVQMSCNSPSGSYDRPVSWYKERQDRSLQRVYQSYGSSKPNGRYSSRVPNLTISNVEISDSGVYYCSSGGAWTFRFFGGARLIVTDTQRPSCSILVPLPLEGTQPIHSIPRLRLIFEANPKWNNFSWDISEESSQDQKGVGVLDKDGVFSVWHLEMIPLEDWTEEEIYSCLVQENNSSSSSAAMPTDEGACIYALYIGIPFIIILLAPSFILLCRKHRARGNSEQAGNRMPRRETPQTNYAEVRYKSRNVLRVD